MGAQLVSHQRHPRAYEPSEMLSIPGNKVRSHRRTKIKYKAGARRQMKTSQQRQPAIKAQSFEFLIAVANTGHCLCGGCTDH
ncbi:hypothetical protein D9M71_638780 [compost metagenome]